MDYEKLKVAAQHRLAGISAVSVPSGCDRAEGLIWNESASKKSARMMLASRSLLLHEEANIAMDYSAPKIMADYPARATPKTQTSIYRWNT